MISLVEKLAKDLEHLQKERNKKIQENEEVRKKAVEDLSGNLKNLNMNDLLKLIDYLKLITNNLVKMLQDSYQIEDCLTYYILYLKEKINKGEKITEQDEKEIKEISENIEANKNRIEKTEGWKIGFPNVFERYKETKIIKNG